MQIKTQIDILRLCVCFLLFYISFHIHRDTICRLKAHYKEMQFKNLQISSLVAVNICFELHKKITRSLKAAQKDEYIQNNTILSDFSAVFLCDIAAG